MPPQRTSDGAGARRGRPKGSKNRASTGGGRAGRAPPPADDEEGEDNDNDNASEPSDPFASSDEEGQEGNRSAGAGAAGARNAERSRGGEEEPEPEKTIPKDLLTRLLHEFFTKDSTRISKDANAGVGKYMDVFVREAIARTAVEKRGGFLEVIDLSRFTQLSPSIQNARSTRREHEGVLTCVI